jgi:hypothetical protein
MIRSAEEILNAELQERVAELEAALKPFAEFYGPHLASVAADFPVTHGSSFARQQITVGDLRRAYAAMAGEPVVTPLPFTLGEIVGHGGCMTCRGYGRAALPGGAEITCPACKGLGRAPIP